MRNKLAEDALDEDMLNLMLSYKSSLGVKGHELEGAIELLRNSSSMFLLHLKRYSNGCPYINIV